MILLLVLSLLSEPTYAGRIRDWCERNLISPEPRQFREFSNEFLIHSYVLEAEGAIYRRRQSSMLSEMGQEIRLRGIGEPFLSGFSEWEYHVGEKRNSSSSDGSILP